jgi:RNA polymerase sigma factor (sigma-70 family)
MQLFSNKTDEELMTLLSSGHLDAVSILFKKYHVQLFHFFLKMGNNKPNSEDLVQAVFERIIRYRHTYKTSMTFRTWMYQIARNVRADDYYKQKPEVPTDFSVSSEHAIADHHSGGYDEILLVQMEKALNYLPSEQREVLLLTRYQQLKYAEVGAILGCTENAVKVKVFRALEQLRSIYFKLEKL